MAENSKIEWTDHTFNPWIGCTKVHEGCKHCYAETMMDSRYGNAKWGPGGTRVMTSDSNWRKPLQWNRKAEIQFNSWERIHKDLPGGEQELLQRGFVKPTRPRVFCASLADVFEDWGGSIRVSSRLPVLTNGEHFVGTDGPEIDEWRFATIDDLRKRLFILIDSTPYLDWLLLTKRPENVSDMLFDPDSINGFEFRKNVSLGTSISTKEHYRQVESLKYSRDLFPVLFLSIEPLLGPMDDLPLDEIDWVIVGGESGHEARPMHPDWVRSIRDQCTAAGVPFFFKQWGEHAAIDQLPEGAYDSYQHHMTSMQRDTDIQRVGKKAAGRLLDGVEWNQLPASMKERPEA